MSYEGEGGEIEEEQPDIVFLSVDDIIDIHENTITRHSPGESLYIRDQGLLESATFSPQHTFEGDYLYGSVVEMAAVLMQSLAGNHPFENGNKRVAFGACSVFLRINGFRLTLTQKEAVDLTVRVVNHQISRDEVIEILRNSIDGVA